MRTSRSRAGSIDTFAPTSLLALGSLAQQIQPFVPQAFEEAPQVGQALGPGPVEPSGAGAPLADQPRVLENSQVLRHSRAGHVEMRGDRPRRQLLVTNQPQDVSPSGLGYRPDRGIDWQPLASGHYDSIRLR